MSLQQLCVLGATGSIGASTLDVVARHPDRYRIFALSGHRRLSELADLCRRFQPVYAAVPDQASAEQLAALLQGAEARPEILVGEGGLEAIAAHPQVDTVMAAIVGAAGLKPTLAAVKAGKRVLLANKEALVMSGALFIEAVQASGATLLPIDSEHNAIFQCLADPVTPGLARKGVRRILLTASGGPFRETPAEQLTGVTPDQACAHPKWSMGRKISVDSATLMNKGLELIEACWLFEATPEQVEVVIHPQSVIHSLVDYVDGSVLAQLGNPDMRTPIAHALAWPERIDSGVAALDLFEIGRLDFERPDEARFPCLRLAREAAQAGGCMPATLNAANEVAVEAFLEGQLGFTEIPRLIEAVLKAVEPCPASDLDAVFAADSTARQLAREWLSRR
ncbi:1-deoxy-D-xylulose-5-phosphate reductoisomerase [Pseudomonas oryzihabitans]|uniref:1-deoxy-D-xylulose-5-phosphate reductoisomerase n=1 Tax=Pseudomonas oryzihabitans TaxID=47885 RepID=UPI003CFF5DCB